MLRPCLCSADSTGPSHTALERLSRAAAHTRTHTHAQKVHTSEAPGGRTHRIQISFSSRTTIRRFFFSHFRFFPSVRLFVPVLFCRFFLVVCFSSLRPLFPHSPAVQVHTLISLEREKKVVVVVVVLGCVFKEIAIMARGRSSSPPWRLFPRRDGTFASKSCD